MAFYIIISLHILCQVFLHIHKAAYFFHYKNQILSMRKCRHHSHRASVLPAKRFLPKPERMLFPKNTSGKCRCRCVLHIIFLQNACCKRNILPLQAVVNRKPCSTTANHKYLRNSFRSFHKNLSGLRFKLLWLYTVQLLHVVPGKDFLRCPDPVNTVLSHTQ